jgi:heterodisulfide reductase subunit A
MSRDSVLVIGAGLAGMKAGLLLANAGKKVYLVEKLPLIGGMAIKDEESFPNFECSTCMVAPIQQEVLQSSDIETMTLSTVEKVVGAVGDFKVTIMKAARYVSMTDCIGCGMCYEPCPVSISNEWEEDLGEMKAIYVPTAGSLPNVPTIDPQHCIKLNGNEECNACAEACMFGAIKLDDNDEKIEVEVAAIVIATGADIYDVSGLEALGYGSCPGVFTPLEFERLFASNGPTSGELTIRDTGITPSRIAIIHCVGRKEQGYCSSVCCMYSLKFAHFLKQKLPEALVRNIHSDICVHDKTYQKFFDGVRGTDTEMLYCSSMENISVSANGSGLKVKYPDGKGDEQTVDADMVILAAAMVPDKGLSGLAGHLGIELDGNGFVRSLEENIGSIETTMEGIFVAGSAEGPKDIQTSVIQAEAAAGRVMACLDAMPEAEMVESGTGE